MDGLYEVSKYKEIFLSLIVQMFEVGQDSATVPTSNLEEYGKASH